MSRTLPIAALKLLAACAMAPLLALGCTSPSPYRPDRTIVRSIPAPQARAALKRMLEKASGDAVPGDRLEGRQVGPEAFEYTYNGTLVRYSYGALDVRLFTMAGAPDGWLFVKLDGDTFDRWSKPLRADGACLWFASREDAETCADALESLKTAALADEAAAR